LGKLNDLPYVPEHLYDEAAAASTEATGILPTLLVRTAPGASEEGDELAIQVQDAISFLQSSSAVAIPMDRWIKAPAPAGNVFIASQGPAYGVAHVLASTTKPPKKRSCARHSEWHCQKKQGSIPCH